MTKDLIFTTATALSVLAWAWFFTKLLFTVGG